MTHRLIIALGCALVAGAMPAYSGALAQAADPAVFRPEGRIAAGSDAPAAQLVQDRGGADRDRMRRGEHMYRDEDGEDDGGWRGPGGWRPGMFRQGMGPNMGQGMGPTVGHGMGPAMMSHAFSGTRIHLRRGESAVNMRCPPDVRLNECIDAVGRLLDRLSTMGSATGGSGAPSPR